MKVLGEQVEFYKWWP